MDSRVGQGKAETRRFPRTLKSSRNSCHRKLDNILFRVYTYSCSLTPEDLAMTDREDDTAASRPLGTRNLRTLLGESLLEERGRDLIQHVLARAKAGDPAALRLCLDRALPRGRDRP